MIAGCGGCPRETAPPANDDPEAAHDRAKVGTPEGRFVGSEACAPCHAEIHAAWTVSRHRATLVPFPSGRGFLGGIPSESGFVVESDGGVRGPGESAAPVRGRAAYLIGGRHRTDLLVRMDDGRLQVFPWSFDVDAGTAFEPLTELIGASPSPDVVAFWTRVGRNADIGCYGCHATGAIVEAVGSDRPLGLTPRSRWVEPGVGCEACHGPGGPHVDGAERGSPGPIGLGVGEPEAEGRVGVCAACHALREPLRSPFDAIPAHVAGAPLWRWADPVLSVPSSPEFVRPFFSDLRPATFQQEAIALGQSGCSRRGGLTCEACHDPHAGGLTEDASGPDGGDPVCLSCHSDLAGRESAHSGHAKGSPGGRCFDCHMAPVLRGPGREAARDHSLSPPTARRDEIPAACATCHAGRPDAAQVTARWSAFSPGPSSTARLEIREALEAVPRRSPGVENRLVAIATDPDRGWFVRRAALALLEETLRQGDRRIAPEPIRPAIDDPNPAIRRAAIRVMGRVAQPDDLERLAALSTSDDPDLAFEAVTALATARTPLFEARIAKLLVRSDMKTSYRANLLLARASIAAGDWPRAEKALLRALDAYPLAVPALNDLGIAWANLDRLEDARRAWSRALALNPQYEAAKANLEN